MVKLISNYRLLLVATHELGHALGIGHSEKPEALMAPSHDEWKGDVKLSKDDIQAIQVKAKIKISYLKRCQEKKTSYAIINPLLL